MESIGKKYGAIITLKDDVCGADFSGVNAAIVAHGAEFMADNRSFKYDIDNARGILKLQVTSLTDFPDFQGSVEKILSAAGLTNDAIEAQYSTPSQGMSR